MIVSRKVLLHVLSHMKHSQAGNKLHLKARYFSARREEQQAACEFKVRIQQEPSFGSVQCTWKPRIPSLFMNTSNLLWSPHLWAKNNFFAMQTRHQEPTSLFGITFRWFFSQGNKWLLYCVCELSHCLITRLQNTELFSTWHVREFVFQTDPWKRKEVLSETSCQQVSGAGGYCETKEQREEINISSDFGLELIFFILF